MQPHATRPHQPPAHLWLGPAICLVLAFQFTQVTAIQQSASDQHSGSQEHGGSHPAMPHQTGPMLSLGSESSSALEASAALAGDDLIAAESSQSPDSAGAAAAAAAAASAAAEHKTFTNAQVVRQEPAQAQMAASVAPVFPQQQAQQQTQAHQQLFSVHPQHMLQARIQHQVAQQQQQQAAPQKAAFNPFMAAALAGNYGPAQQQMAAAAAANLQQHGPGPHAQMQAQQAQQHGHYVPAPHHQQLMAGPHAQAQIAANQAALHVPPGAHHQMAAAVHHHQQQQAHHQPRQQVEVGNMNGGGQQAAVSPGVGTQLAVQESSVRQNVVPAPNFNSMLESNSIELNDSPNQANQAQAQQQQQALALASSSQHPMIAAGSSSVMQQEQAGAWPLQAPDIPKIVNLEVKCEKNLMKVSIEFDKVFNGVIFSKGHYNQGQCLHVGQNSGKHQAYFDISINSCGTQGNTQNGLYGMGGNTGSGTYFENTIVVQYDPNVQEVYDHARKLRCTWHDQYEKAVTFRPFPVDMLDIVRADFAGDNVGCWMQIQVGKGPWASEVAGIVKIGQTMTMVLAIKDEENKFDMLVRNCFAHDGKRGPIELVDKSGCITRPKLMSRFTKIKNFGSSATVLSYAHFQAFKFPDSMEVHFQCTIQICRHQCPEQCSAGPNALAGPAGGESYSESTISGTFNINGGGPAQTGSGGESSVHLRKFGSSSGAALSRERRDVGAVGRWPAIAIGNGLLSSNGSHHHHTSHLRRSNNNNLPATKTVGLNRVIQVVSTGDLAFALQQQQQQTIVNGTFEGDHVSQLADSSASQLSMDPMSNQICMSSFNFVLALVVLVLILLCSCLLAVSLYLRQRSLAKRSSKLIAPVAPPAIGGCRNTSAQGSNNSHQAASVRANVPSNGQQLYTGDHHHQHHLNHLSHHLH